ncbi:MAG TPA: adenylyl-sulfate kinase [Phycisphaerae bacterium]
MSKSTNITYHHSHVPPESRHALSRVKPAVIWLTGLSGTGKSTIAMLLEQALIADRRLAYVLDGDNVRHGLSRNLSFTADDRTENIRRIGEVAKLFLSAGIMPITAFISPFRADRDAVRALLPPGDFIEVFLDAPLEVCESRDPKGLYKKARSAAAAGQGLQFTGIDSPYESPTSPELHLHTDQSTPDQCAASIIGYLRNKGRLLD